MIIGLCLSRSDHSALDKNLLKIKILKKKKKKISENFFFGFFLHHQMLYGISIPGDHVITRDCMDFQCIVVKKKKKN